MLINIMFLGNVFVNRLFSVSGIIGGLILQVTSAVAAGFSLYILVASARRTGASSYALVFLLSGCRYSFNRGRGMSWCYVSEFQLGCLGCLWRRSCTPRNGSRSRPHLHGHHCLQAKDSIPCFRNLPPFQFLHHQKFIQFSAATQQC